MTSRPCFSSVALALALAGTAAAAEQDCMLTAEPARLSVKRGEKGERGKEED